MKKLLPLVLIAACGGKDDKKKDDQRNGQNPAASASTFYAQDKLNLTQNFDAVTPNSFKSQPNGAGLRLLYSDNRETECEKAGSRDSVQYETCKLAYEIRDRFFGSAGTNIRQRLKSFEDRINGNLARARGGYIPCLDPDYGGGVTVSFAGNPPTDGVAPAFSQTTIDYRIDDKGAGVATGVKLALSCLDSFGSQGFAHQVAFGKADKTWSLVEDQSDGKTALGNITADGTIDLWFGFGTRSKYDGPEDEVVTQDKNGNPVIFIDDEGNGDATLANIKAVPALGIIGLSVIGEYGGECGTRIIMNDTALYLKADNNRYGACFSGDVFDKYTSDNNLNADGDSRGAYHPEWDNIELCLKVSGQVPEVGLQGMKHCVDSGLVTYAADGTTVADPFTRINLPHLSAKGDQAPSGALRVRAWMAGQMHKTIDLSAVPPYGSVPLAPGASVTQVEGFEALSYGFGTPSGQTPEPVATTAACNASDAERTLAFTQSFTLKISDLFAFLPAPKTPDAPAPEELQNGLVATLNSGLQQTGETASVFEVDVGGSVGVTYRSVVSGSVSLSFGSTEVASGTFSGSTDPADLTNMTRVKLNPTGTPALASDTVLTATISGTLLLSCGSQTAATQTAAANVGIPKLTVYAQPQPPSGAQ